MLNWHRRLIDMWSVWAAGNFFSPSPQLFFVVLAPSQTPQLRGHLTDSLPSQTVVLHSAPIELISAFWTETMPLQVFYDLRCSIRQGHSAQRLSGSFRGLQTSFFSLQSLLHANKERLHSIQSSFSPAVVHFYNLLSYLLSPVCLGWDGGRSGSQIRTVTLAVMLYMTRRGDRCLKDHSLG